MDKDKEWFRPICGRIVELISGLSLSQKDFRLQIGASSGVMSDIVASLRPPTIKQLISICGVAVQNGYSLAWLLLGKGANVEVRSSSLPSDYVDLLDAYARLNEQGRKTAINQVQSLERLFPSVPADDKKESHA